MPLPATIFREGYSRCEVEVLQLLRMAEDYWVNLKILARSLPPPPSLSFSPTDRRDETERAGTLFN